MSTEAMKRIKSLLQDCAKIDSHTISAVVAECDMAILAQHPATTEPVKVAPYNPTEEMRWAMKRIDPALSSEQCRALWSAAWSATPSTHPAPSVPGDDFDLICNAIDKADTITMEGDYMLDSDDCIAVVRVMQVLLSVRDAMIAAKDAT